MIRRTTVASLVGFFFLFSASAALATEDIYTDAIHVLKRMEEKTAAVKMCGAGLLEKEKKPSLFLKKLWKLVLAVQMPIVVVIPWTVSLAQKRMDLSRCR